MRRVLHDFAPPPIGARDLARVHTFGLSNDPEVALDLDPRCEGTPR
jgi:hypothetical protein